MGPISQFDLFSITGPGLRTEENAEQLKFMVGGAEGGSRYGASERANGGRRDAEIGMRDKWK